MHTAFASMVNVGIFFVNAVRGLSRVYWLTNMSKLSTRQARMENAKRMTSGHHDMTCLSSQIPLCRWIITQLTIVVVCHYLSAPLESQGPQWHIGDDEGRPSCITRTHMMRFLLLLTKKKERGKITDVIRVSFLKATKRVTSNKSGGS